MVEDDESSIHVDGTSGVQTSHKPKHIAVQTMTILLHKLDEVPAQD